MSSHSVAMSHTQRCNQYRRHFVEQTNEYLHHFNQLSDFYRQKRLGCIVIPVWAHPDVFWYQMLFYSKTWSSVGSTHPLCNSKLLSNFLCLYLLLVWDQDRDSNFCTNSNDIKLLLSIEGHSCLGSPMNNIIMWLLVQTNQAHWQRST